jgi:DNA-binding NtrC family response regulator
MISILIVDDSSDNLSLLSDFLIEKSYQITACTSGSEALEIIKNQSFELVISDYDMPNGNGLWLLEEIQKLGSSPKVIIMSSENKLDENFVQLKGAYAFLRRPIDWKKLESLIQEIKSK